MAFTRASREFPASTLGCHNSVSAMHIFMRFWFALEQTRTGRQQETERALQFVQMFMNSKCPHVAIENPVGCISSEIRKPDQIIQPYNFGEDASKKTCLWLKGLPKLKNTDYFSPRIVNGKERWGNQTDSGQNKLGPSVTRAAERSKTYPGIAKAMAEQWGAYLIDYYTY